MDDLLRNSSYLGSENVGHLNEKPAFPVRPADSEFNSTNVFSGRRAPLVLEAPECCC